MSVIACMPPTVTFAPSGQNYTVTQAGVNVPDYWSAQRIISEAARQGVALTVDGTAIGVPGAFVNPDPQIYEWDWAFQPPNVVAGGWLSSVIGGMQLGRYGYGYNASNATGMDWRWRVPVSAGSWRLDVIADKDVTRATQTWEISYDNGSTWNLVGTWDQYSSTNNVNNQSASFNLTVPFTGVALLRLRNPTRNGAATGWYCTLSIIRLTRTA